MKKVKRKMLKVLCVVAVILVVIIIYFNLPYSRLRNEFKYYKSISKELTYEHSKRNSKTIDDLPDMMQKFYSYTGLENKLSCYHVGFYFKNADFFNMASNKMIKINYDEHIYGVNPAHLAFIDSSIYGIPFQGLDSYVNGVGRMKGVLAKNITLFNVDGEKMNKSALVTWLCESIFMPKEILSEDIKLEEIDLNSIKASIKYKEQEVSGIFHFADDGRLLEFTTEDRAYTKSDGTMEYVRWSAKVDNYVEKNGFVLPDEFKAVWHFADKDLTYFDGKNMSYTFYEK